jgi:hypothetical protein
MSDQLIVLPSKAGGGSPRGLSYWKAFDECPRQKLLDKENPGEVGTYIIPWRTGHFFHQLLEYYYPDGLDDTALEFDGCNLDADWTETLRLFREYKKHFPCTEFGRDVATEEDFEINGHPEIFGVKEYSGRWDMHVWLDVEEVAWIEQTRNVTLRGPGLYLVDTKTTGTHKANLVTQFTESEQLHGYMMAWDFLHPNDKCQGMLVNCVIRHNNQKNQKAQAKEAKALGLEGDDAARHITGLTKTSFVSIFVPPPDESQREIFRSNMDKRRLTRALHGDDATNTAFCFYYKTCRHLEEGTCDRIMKTPRKED